MIFQGLAILAVIVFVASEAWEWPAGMLIGFAVYVIFGIGEHAER